MAAPKQYTQLQRRAIYELADRGINHSEIARRCAAGEAGVPPFEIPRTTVRDIARQERERTAVPEGAED
jgi:hypothetical protein